MLQHLYCSYCFNGCFTSKLLLLPEKYNLFFLSTVDKTTLVVFYYITALALHIQGSGRCASHLGIWLLLLSFAPGF